MTITKTITLETTDTMINRIIEELHYECDSWAHKLLEDTDFVFEYDEYGEYREKLSKEIFDDVVTALLYDREKAE